MRALPVVTKAMLMERFEEWVCDPRPRLPGSRAISSAFAATSFTSASTAACRPVARLDAGACLSIPRGVAPDTASATDAFIDGFVQQPRREAGVSTARLRH